MVFMASSKMTDSLNSKYAKYWRLFPSTAQERGFGDAEDALEWMIDGFDEDGKKSLQDKPRNILKNRSHVLKNKKPKGWIMPEQSTPEYNMLEYPIVYMIVRRAYRKAKAAKDAHSRQHRRVSFRHASTLEIANLFVNGYIIYKSHAFFSRHPSAVLPSCTRICDAWLFIALLVTTASRLSEGLCSSPLNSTGKADVFQS